MFPQTPSPRPPSSSPLSPSLTLIHLTGRERENEGERYCEREREQVRRGRRREVEREREREREVEREREREREQGSLRKGAKLLLRRLVLLEFQEGEGSLGAQPQCSTPGTQGAHTALPDDQLTHRMSKAVTGAMAPK